METFFGVVKCDGGTYDYQVQVPKRYLAQELALVVTHDGMNTAEAAAMDVLSAAGEAPPFAVIGIAPGRMVAPHKDGFDRNLRCNDYDLFSSAYVDRLVDTILPAIRDTHGLRFSNDPNLHLISGGSSGGISAWNGVWFRNDFFRRAYLSSPTFSAMNRGNMAPVWIRLFETKPIRVYLDYSESEPDAYFGNSYCAAMEGRLALEFAGYDYAWAYYPGEGHCSRLYHGPTAEEVLRWLWKDWQTKPVRPLRVSTYAADLLVEGTTWEPATEMPEAGSTLSSDGWRLYSADPARACVCADTVAEDGTLQDHRVFASLQVATDFRVPGAVALCVDRDDRVYAATELGIQCIRSFGLIDVILPLPGDVPAKAVAIRDGYLYAGDGAQCWRRPVKTSQKADTPTPPCHGWYYRA